MVTLVSSRDRVLPSEDADAAAVIEKVFSARGSVLAKQGRAKSVKREGDGVVVTLEDGREIRGSHALMTVGAVPNTADMGLAEVGVEVAGADSSRWTRSPGRRCPESTRPATAPAC